MGYNQDTPKNTTSVYGPATYVIKGSDDYIQVHTDGGPVTLWVPNILNSGFGGNRKNFYIVDATGNAGTNNITLVSNNNLINGLSAVVLDADNITAELVIISNTEWQANLSSDQSSGGGIWGLITGNPVNQTDIQNGTLQGGTFTPINSIITLGDTFRLAFEKVQGQINYILSVITTIVGSFIPFVSQNYVLIKATGIATVNGTALLSALTSAQALTPNGLALSATNRAVVYLWAGVYNIGSSFLSLGQFVDIIAVGDPEDIIITGTNSLGTIHIQNSNDYILKNITIDNTSTGGSIIHNASQTDNGTWWNLILKNYNTEATIFAGNYNYINSTVTRVLNGTISGTVLNSTFLQGGCCGFADSSAITISGTIQNCMGGDLCFGATTTGNVIITGNILNCTALQKSFGYSTNNSVSISGKIKNCFGGMFYCYGASLGNTVSISGSIDNCIAQFNSIGFSDNTDVTISGTIANCRSSTVSFGASNGNGIVTISGVIENCIGDDDCFGFSNTGNIILSGKIIVCLAASNSFGYSASVGSATISGKILSCIATSDSFGHATSVTISGTIDNSSGTTQCFGNTSSTGILISCTRTSAYGSHAGTIQYCDFSDNSASPCITLESGAVVRYSTIYQAGVGECFDASVPITASVYHCAANKAVEDSGNITNSIGTPYNVIDSVVTI